MRKNFTQLVLSAALLTAASVPMMAQETVKPVADLLDVRFNSDGTAEDVSAMGNDVEVLGNNLSTYFNEGFGFTVANFTNTWGGKNSSGYRINYEQNEDFKNKLADGHSIEIVVMADYSSLTNEEIKPFSSMQAGGTGFLMTNSSRGNVMTFLPNASADGASNWNWCTSGIVPDKKVYYHFLGVWNQEEAKAYIYCNGQLMNTISTGSVFRFASDGNKWFCIGGDPSGSGVEAGWCGDVAVARIYSNPLTGEEAEALWEDAKEGVTAANVLMYKQKIEEGRAYIAAESFMAYKGDTQAYSEQLDKMEELATASNVDALREELITLNSLRDILEKSAAAYQAYKEKVENTRTYLEENTDFEGDARDILEDYLQSDEEPGGSYTNGGALYILENQQLTIEQIKAESETVDQMLQRAIETGVKSGVEITNLFTNPDFSDGVNGWQGALLTNTRKSPTTGYIGAECWAKNCNTYQTLENRNNGVYVMSINGAYRPFNDRYNEYYAAQVYMNDISLYLPTVYETRLPVTEAVDGENCYITQTNPDDVALDLEIFSNKGAGTDLEAYGIRGCTSIANAASAGRALNYLVTKVTDNTLTIGIRNENTIATQDWLGVSNLHVKYYETLKDAESYIDKTLECMQARANVIINFVPSTGSDYAQFPGCPKELTGKLQSAIDSIALCQSPEEKYALTETFSNLFNEVLEARKAYVAMVDEALIILDIANNLDEAEVITPEQFKFACKKYEEVLDAFEHGTYTTEQAKEISALKETGFYPELVDGEYLLTSNAQLAYFGIKAVKGERGKLMVDIPNFTLTQMIANFRGILDGNGHKVTMNINSTQNNASFIADMQSGAEIHNLVFDGTIITTQKFASTVAASTQENSRISNITSHVNIISETVGDGTHGGLVGVVNGYTTIDNCLFDGSITGSATNSCGGLVGWHNAAGKITNCLQIADLQVDAANSNTIGRAPTKFVALNTYYKNALGDLAGTQATEEQLKSGEICYLLNHGNTENPVWFQNIGTDEHPVLDATHQTVGKTKDGAFTNDKDLFYTEEIEEAEIKADLLDIIFNLDGTATDISPMQNEVVTVGEVIPTVTYSDTYKRNIATFDNELGSNGNSAYKIDYTNNPKLKEALAGGHTLEAIVKINYEGEIPNKEMKPFSSMEQGGTGFLISTKSGARQNEMTFLPNISTNGNNTWCWGTSGIVPEAGKYYHLIGVYDETNAKTRIYVDGKLCNEVNAPGIFRLPTASCHWFCIGGDPGANNAVQASWNGDVVLARIYGRALNEEQVQMIVSQLEKETPVEGISQEDTKAKDGIYTINGIRVQKTTKGLYIINGKKVMVK